MFSAPGSRRLAPLLLVLAATSSCAPAGKGRPLLRIEAAWVRPAAAPGAGNPAGDNSAAYFTVVNGGNAADTLVGVVTDAAARADVHRSRVEDGVARMLPVPRLAVPAHGRIACEPGGYHVMLMGVKRDLRVGGRVRLVLRFRASGDRVIDAPVLAGPPR